MVENWVIDQNLSPLETTISPECATNVIKKDTKHKTVQRTVRDPQNELMWFVTQKLHFWDQS
jgi:hypothetical protein